MISLEPSAARDIAVDAKRCSKSNWRNLSGFPELAPQDVWGSDQELAVAIGYVRSTAKNVKAIFDLARIVVGPLRGPLSSDHCGHHCWTVCARASMMTQRCHTTLPLPST